MNPDLPRLQREVDRIRQVYSSFHEGKASKKLWPPFTQNETDLRCQQAQAFRRAMVYAGHSSLADLKILDYGCGEGRHLRFYLDCGADPRNLFGIEIDEATRMIAQARSPHLSILEGDGVHINLPDDSMDLVSLYFVMSSIGLEDLRRQISSELVRVVKNGGLVYWWDMRHMAAASGKPGERLQATDLFAQKIVSTEVLGIKPTLGEVCRPFRGLTRCIVPILDLLAHPPVYESTLIRINKTL